MSTDLHLRLRPLWHTVGAAMVLLITFLTLSPSDSPILVFSVWDKLLHFTGYAAVGAWYAMVLSRKHFFGLWVMLLAMGIALELLQGFVPGRATEALDAVANALGATAGVALGLTPWRYLLATLERLCLPTGTR